MSTESKVQKIKYAVTAHEILKNIILEPQSRLYITSLKSWKTDYMIKKLTYFIFKLVFRVALQISKLSF